jgi:hypothetical protein
MRAVTLCSLAFLLVGESLAASQPDSIGSNAPAETVVVRGEGDLEARPDTLGGSTFPGTVGVGCRSVIVSLVGYAVLEMTDPLGRRVTYDFDRVAYVSEIPSCIARRNPLLRAEGFSLYGATIEVENVIDGTYWIDVIGYREGLAGICVSAHDRVGQVAAWDNEAEITAGGRLKYSASFSFRPKVAVEVHKVASDRGGSVNPRGRFVRYYPKAHAYLTDIPNAVGHHGPVPRLDGAVLFGDSIEIPDAIDGDYTIKVKIWSGPRFGLCFVAYDCMGDVTSWSGGEDAKAGDEIAYRVRFSSKPGAAIEVHEVAPDSLENR